MLAALAVWFMAAVIGSAGLFIISTRSRDDRRSSLPVSLALVDTIEPHKLENAPNMANVAVAAHLALGRVMQGVNTCRIKVDVAVAPDLIVYQSTEWLVDTLEAIFDSVLTRTHDRLLLTAVASHHRVAIRVTSNHGPLNREDFGPIIETVAARIALRGGHLDVDVMTKQSTSVVLRLEAVELRLRPAAPPYVGHDIVDAVGAASA